MNYKTIVFFPLMLACSWGAAAQSEKAISADLLGEIENSCVLDAHLKSVQNALAQVDGNKIAQDWGKMKAVDSYFSHRLKDQKITDQKQTGRCWMFAGLNILRPVAARNLNCEEIEFSQNYLYFFEKLEKANTFLEAVIASREKPSTERYVEFLLKQNVQDGQNWLGFIELVKKYGVVPKDIMPETYSSSNSGHVNSVLSRKFKQYAIRIRQEKNADKLTSIKLEALKDVYRILAMNFGIPPSKFEWRYETKDKKVTQLKTFTPRQFYTEAVGAALEEYYALYSIPTLQFNKKYEIDLDRTVSDNPDMFFVNCPLENLKNLAKTCLLDDQPVWFGCDVGQESSTENGLMLPGIYDYASMYGMDFSMSRKELFETYSSSPTHNMVFTGLDVLDGGVKKWLVENSWGDNKGKKGYFYMSDEWFDNYVQVIVIQKKYIPKDILAVFSTKAEVLPPWDPMWKAVNIQ